MDSSKKYDLKRFLPMVSIVGLAFTLVAWAFASPVGATPDEDFHLVSIWCAGDGTEGVCAPAENNQTADVDSALVESACFAQQATVSAKCQMTEAVFDNHSTVTTTRGNFSGNYPQGFYSVMNLFAGENIQIAVLVMRLFNVVLTITLITTLWLLIRPVERQSLYFTTVLTIVPLGLFLIPSINPSSWAILGVIATFFATVGAFNALGRRRIGLISVGALGLLMASSSRYDGLLYSLLALSAALILAHNWHVSKRKIWIIAGSTAALVLSVLLLGGTSIIEKLSGLAGTSNTGESLGAFGVLTKNLTMLPILFAGFSGAMNLGWLDTAMPITMWMLAATALWAALFSRISALTTRALWVSGALALALVGIPLLVLQASFAIVGENVQSRYLYPLMLALAAAVLYDRRSEARFFSTAQISALAAALFVSQALALYFNMSRYISGVSAAGSSNLNAAAQQGWWWQSAPAPMFMLALGIVGFAMFLATSALFAKRQPESSAA